MKRKKRTKQQKLRSKADCLWKEVIFKLYGEHCVVCDKPAVHSHHFFPKGLYGHLRYNTDNGVPLCFHCHFSRHHKGDPKINQTIIDKRGLKWLTNLKVLAYQRPFYSLNTIKYYEKQIENLIKKLDSRPAQK